MTSIDFYISESPDTGICNMLACRLSEKACQTRTSTFIHTQTEEHSQQLDKLLWSFKQQSFIPHKIYHQDDTDKHLHPVLIGHNVEPETNLDLLINLDNEIPDFYSRFNRVIEIVSNNEHQRERSRQHYKFYKDRGYIINTHTIK